MPESELTAFERREIEMNYAVPLIRKLQDVLGAETVINALAEARRRELEKARAEYQGEGGNCEDVKVGFDYFAGGDALQFDILEAEKEQASVDVKKCRYAELMTDLDASDLGELLICSGDFASVEALGMTLTRTQTRMSGAAYCDFRFKSRS